jgi:hypothetical protein
MIFGDEEPHREDTIIDIEQERTVTGRDRHAAAEHTWATRFTWFVHTKVRSNLQSSGIGPVSRDSIVCQQLSYSMSRRFSKARIISVCELSTFIDDRS